VKSESALAAMRGGTIEHGLLRTCGCWEIFMFFVRQPPSYTLLPYTALTLPRQAVSLIRLTW